MNTNEDISIRIAEVINRLNKTLLHLSTSIAVIGALVNLSLASINISTISSISIKNANINPTPATMDNHPY